MLQSKVLGFVSWGREVCRFRQSVVARSMQDCKTRPGSFQTDSGA